MKKILLINILLVIFSINIEAQYSRLSFVFERFQLTKSYDSAIIYGEEILKTNKFDESIPSKSFYSYLLNKLSLSYNEFNQLEKNEILYSIFLRDSHLIDNKNGNIIHFLSNITRSYQHFGNNQMSDSILNLTNKIVNQYHFGNINYESIYLKDFIAQNIEKNNLVFADSLLTILRSKINTTYSSSNYVMANNALASAYEQSIQDYSKAETLLNDAIFVDSIFNCEAKDLLTNNLLTLYSNSYQFNKLNPFIEKKLNEIKYKQNTGELDFMDILNLSRYCLLLSDMENFDNKNLTLIDLYKLFKSNLNLIPKEYDGEIANCLIGISLSLEKFDTELALEANNLAVTKLSAKANYLPFSEDVYLNFARLYSKIFFDSNNTKTNYLDSVSKYLSIALYITKNQFGENSKEHMKSLDGLYNYYYWKDDYVSALNLAKYFIEFPCSNGTISNSVCRGYLYNMYVGYLRTQDTSNAIIYLKKWNDSWKEYITKNSSFILPNYQVNDELRNCIESYNGEVLRRSYIELYPSVFNNLITYKYFQLRSKLEIKKSGKDIIDSLSNINFEDIKSTIRNRQNLNELLKFKNDKTSYENSFTILNNLNKDEVCIEIFKCKYPNDLLRNTFSNQYYALIGYGDTKKFDGVFLGEETELKNKFDIIYSTPIHGNDYNILYGNSENGLSSFLLKPLLPLIKNYKTLYISTYGLLSNVNFNILAINDNEILEDKFNIHQLFSLSDLAKFKNESITISKEVNINLFGGIHYDTLTIENNKNYNNYKSRSGKDNWGYLPETEFEITSISNSFSKKGYLVNNYTGNHATESIFYSLANKKTPNIFHFATHGFSIDNKIKNQAENTVLNDPLDLSGIILAGANKSWGSNKIGVPNQSDGILTSKEISALELGNCRLVTLSACETGLGAQLSNDGIFGLQRGLKLAGVNNLLTSLWAVPDKSTRELFEYFYNYVLEGNNFSNSLRLARKELRKKYKSPYYWGAFTLIE